MGVRKRKEVNSLHKLHNMKNKSTEELRQGYEILKYLLTFHQENKVRNMSLNPLAEGLKNVSTPDVLQPSLPRLFCKLDFYATGNPSVL